MKEFKSKVDLHLHLDGSLPLEIVPQLAELSGIDLPAERINSLFSLAPGCKSLVDYLKCFDWPVRLLQTAPCLSLATRSLVKKLYAEGVVLAEIRFAPMLHKKRGLNGPEIVEAVIQGMLEGLRDCPGMKAGIILCMMVGADKKENMETVELAKQFLGKGVVALDIAGAEGMLPPQTYQDLFVLAKQLQIPYTIHAGECGSYENIEYALELGASRIGHGVAAIYSEKTIQRLVQNQVPLEICVTSNLQTLAIPETQIHPVKKLFNLGVCVTINTDNMTVSDTCLEKEYHLLMEHYGFSEKDIGQVQDNAIRASFLT